MNSGIFLMLKENHLFGQLNKEQLEAIVEASNIHTLHKGSRLYNTNENASHVYVMIKGAVKLGATLKNGNTYLKDVLLDGDVFGENILVTQSRKEYAEALNRSTYISIDAATFMHTLERNPLFTQQVMHLMVHRIKELDRRLHQFKFFTARQRIEAFLTTIGERFMENKKVVDGYFTHSLSHMDLAEITDTSRQTVARVMSELKKENLINFASRKPTTLNIDGLLKSV